MLFSCNLNAAKDWSVLIFMAADNDLSPYALNDIQEMESQVRGEQNLGASSDKINVVLEVDFVEPSGSFRYQIEQFKKEYNPNSSIQSPLVEHLPEDYLPIKDRFKSFLRWGKENYPADKYLVVIWGHGEGYKGFSYDDSDQSFITPKGLKELIEEKVDVLAFDACLMQNLESLYEISTLSDFVIGSNQIQNYLGLPYRKILDELQSDLSAYELSKNISLWTKKSWDEEGYQAIFDSNAFESFSMSALINQQLVPGIVEHLKRVATHLKSYLNEFPFRLSDLKLRLELAPRFQGGSMDLGLFYGIIEEMLWEEEHYQDSTSRSKMLSQSVKMAKKQIGFSLIDYQYGPLYFSSLREGDYLLGYFAGVSLWLPRERVEYEFRKDEFRESKLYRDLRAWSDVLDLVFSEQGQPIFDLD